MNDTLAIELAKCKMRELGYEDYTLRMRHFLLQGGETRELKIGNNLLILLQAQTLIRVSSKNGNFNIYIPESGEMQYVHSGNILLTNFDLASPVGLEFLQVIPINSK